MDLYAAIAENCKVKKEVINKKRMSLKKRTEREYTNFIIEINTLNFVVLVSLAQLIETIYNICNVGVQSLTTTKK